MCDLRRLPPTRVRDLNCHSAGALRHAVATGVVRRPFRGVVVGTDLGDAVPVLVRAAQLSVGSDFPASHPTAASLLGFGVVDDGDVHLCGGETEVDRGQPGLRVHSTFRPPVPVTVHGVTTTGPERTAVDLARSLNVREQLVVLDAALRTGLVTTESLTTEAALHAGLRGVVGVRNSIRVADGRAESPQESRLRWIALAAGLPPLDLQIPVVTPSVRYRLDMGYERWKIGIEYDGELHVDRLGWDRARHNALDALGWRMLYFTKTDILRAQATADRIAGAIGHRAGVLPLLRRVA